MIPFEDMNVFVVINNFNYAEYIGEALESVLRQLLTAHEIIDIDDGSSDHSVKVVRGFVDLDP